mmetsp:Transcript_5773/g.6636  ORF Transcript_5773/g.6636 Transcript_5773/m.6636 type:complete len:210 (+) Transcript_5773:127-756(+)|eukprot:CAMPEP_0197847926 /NCGR_PEP_ID=MMETSP1438-20131217/7517_1 /TAXON_ID=1461541 /ORGANISM="Pterosperma sp., Strain CCMP1384" /LENGTH=209 /DNA_ID=CAMNT_0043460007 /DNA_START=125 /DNA_END=754 /DNA_ORIENTATION=+
MSRRTKEGVPILGGFEEDPSETRHTASKAPVSASRYTEQNYPTEFAVFAHLDADSSGHLCKSEIYEALEKLGETKSAARFMRCLDENGDGEVTFKEFCQGYGNFMKKVDNRLIINTRQQLEAALIDAMQKQNFPNVRAAFLKFDKDKNNQICLDELLAFVNEFLPAAVTTALVKEWMQEYDKNGNGKFHIMEFDKCIGEFIKKEGDSDK